MEKPAWMSDEAVKNIPEEKLNFLFSIVSENKGKSQKEVMANLMLCLKMAKEKHITFTPDEIQKIITCVKKYSSKEELDLLNKLKTQHKL